MWLGRIPARRALRDETENPVRGNIGRAIRYVIFDEGIDAKSVELAFGTPVAAMVRSGLCNGFFLDKSQRVDDRTFKVSGVVPWCTSFTYVLTTVLVQTDSRGHRQYQNGTGFKSDVSIELKNMDRSFFPDIKNVRPNPPAKRWWNRMTAKSVPL